MKELTIKEKQLLLEDLCARLPYGTRVRYTYAFAGVAGINEYSDEGTLSYDKLQDFSLPNVGYERRRVICILSYLRPMFSITEEEKKEFNSLINGVEERCINAYGKGGYTLAFTEVNDWLNAHHFDYRSLIPIGLALEAPEGMYNIKEK